MARARRSRRTSRPSRRSARSSTRVAPGGTSVEPGFELRRGGPRRANRPDPAGDDPRLRAGARRARRRIAPSRRSARRSGTSRRSACGPIGELRTRVVDEADWAEAWKEHFHVLRLGRRLVIKPSWRRHRRAGRRGRDRSRSRDGLRDGPPPDDPAVPRRRWRRRADRGPLGPRPRRRLRLGDPVDRGGQARRDARARRRHRPDRGRGDRRQRPPQPASAGGSARATGTIPTGEGPFDLVLANLIASSSSSSRRPSRDELRPGGTLIASGIFIDREAESRRRSRAPGLRGVRRWPESDWVALDGRPTGPTGSPAPTIAACPRVLFPVLLVAHIALAIAPLRARRCCCRSRFRARRGSLEPASSRAASRGSCSRCRRAARSGSASGLAITGLALVAIARSSMLAQPWLLVALVIYAVNLGLAYFVQVPRLRSLIGLARGERSALAGARPAPALHLVRDGRARRYHRLPDEHEAGAVVTPKRRRRPIADDCLFCRIVAGEIPSTRVAEDDAVHRDPRHRAARADPRPAHAPRRTSPRPPS